MADNISILIRAILEKSSKAQLENELKNIEQKLKPINIKANIDSFKEFKDASGETYKTITKITNELGQQVSITQKMGEETGRTILTNYKKQREELQKINIEQSKYWSQRVKETVSSMTQKPDELVKMADYYKQLEKSSAEYTEQIYKNKLAQKDLLDTIRGLRGKDGAFIVDDNLKKLNNLETTIRNLNPNTKDFAKNLRFAKSELKAITTTTNIYKKEVQDANKYTNIFGQSILSAGKKFASWLMIGNVIVSAINSVKFGINTIIELDTAITDLKKVSDEIGASVGIREFLTDVNELAIKVGHSTNAAIKSVTDFKKLGYSLAESQVLAEQALIYSNVSDQNIEDATKSLISTLKGFQLGTEDVLRVMDSFNEVGNNFSITSAGIGAALQRSASSLYEANNTLEESIGLIVAANSSIQNVEKVGNGLNVSPLYQ